MVNLVGVNDKLIFWKRFFFEEVVVRLCEILREIEKFQVGSDNNNGNKSMTVQQ